MTSTPPTRRYARRAQRSCTRFPTSSGASGASSFATQTATWSTWSAIADRQAGEAEIDVACIASGAIGCIQLDATSVEDSAFWLDELLSRLRYQAEWQA